MNITILNGCYHQTLSVDGECCDSDSDKEKLSLIVKKILENEKINSEVLYRTIIDLVESIGLYGESFHCEICGDTNCDITLDI